MLRTVRWLATTAALMTALAHTTPASAQGTTVYRYETTQTTTAPTADPDWTRFRFGVSGVGGGMVNDGPDIGMGGLELRLGIQVGDLFAVYYMPVGLIGSFTSRPSGDSVAGLMWNNAMIDFTIVDFLTIGGGPSLDFVWGCDSRFQDEVSCDTSDVFFGGHGRVALNLMPMGGPGARYAMTLSFDVHPTVFDWDDGEVGVTMLGGLGFEMM